MTAPEISEIIDLERYPVHQPQSERYQALLDEGRRSLDERALYSFPGFIRAQMIEPMAAELNARVPEAVSYESHRLAYDYADTTLPDDHPRNRLHYSKYYQVLNYQIANDSPLRRVFYCQPLTDFLRQICGYDQFYRSDCPHLALTAKIADTGGADGWHFDSNDVVFSLLLQAPEAGGAFEYAPYLRTETDERYDCVGQVLNDPDSHARRPAMAEGNLTIFKGDLSLHRVTPVEGRRRRIVALFCYDQEPGTVFAESYIRELHNQMPPH